MEAIMVVLDTTEYMRNSDYFPSRLYAEKDAAYTVFSRKTAANPQSGVGLMTLSGSVKVSFVQSTSHFRQAMEEVKIEPREHGDFAKSLQVAQLALRHRNPSQRQRVVVFVGSPVAEKEEELRRLAGRLKKNSVAVDIVNFGQEGDNASLLSEFVAQVNTGDDEHASHFLDVPPGIDELSGMVASSAILGGFSAGDFFDDDDDPELAMAMRMSLEESRQQAA